MTKYVLLVYALVLIGGLGGSIAWAGHGAEPGAEAAAAEGPGLFSGSFADSLWTVAAFALLLLVLGKFAWKPLLGALIARQNHIEHQLQSAEESRRRAEQMLEDYKQQGLALLQQATEQAQRHQQEVTEKTRQEALAIRRRAQEEIESARAAAVEELWRQTGEIVQRVGTEVLGRALTEKDNERLIHEAVSRVRQGGGSQ
jgi:F-type H+-transporting ATPase subunit b